jgi:hypothetical protein
VHGWVKKFAHRSERGYAKVSLLGIKNTKRISTRRFSMLEVRFFLNEPNGKP